MKLGRTAVGHCRHALSQNNNQLHESWQCPKFAQADKLESTSACLLACMFWQLTNKIAYMSVMGKGTYSEANTFHQDFSVQLVP